MPPAERAASIAKGKLSMDLATLGKTPIEEDNPVGRDMRYDPQFEVLQDEIEKLSSPTASGQVDWGKIVEGAAKILSESSKDLTVASYLAVGLVRMHKIEGLGQGLQILSDMLESYWDKLYPPKRRMRGRAGAITWWMERIEGELKGVGSQPLTSEQAERMRANLKRIDEILVAKMPDPPLLRPVQRILEALPVQSQEEVDAPSAAAEPSAESDRPAEQAARQAVPEKSATRDSSPAAADMTDAVASEQDARRAADAAFQRMRQVSLFLLQQNIKNPAAYRYRRMASWAKLEGLPPNSNGITQIPPPAPQAAEPLSALYDEGNWPALILNAEPRVSQFIFWFDLQFYVAEALKNLGAGHRKALTAVIQETACLLKRLPGVEKLSFNDETPFAAAATRKWLQTLQSVQDGPEDQAARTTAGGPDNRFAQAVQEARAMARKKQLVEAINLLQQEMLRSDSRRQKMRWRLAIAQVLLGVKKAALALPHLEQILSDIDAFNLEVWDPALALEGLTAAWKGFGSQTVNEHKARAALLLNRIARLDPAQALQMNP
jgi:type VI secretion system protein VasJ